MSQYELSHDHTVHGYWSNKQQGVEFWSSYLTEGKAHIYPTKSKAVQVVGHI